MDAEKALIRIVVLYLRKLSAEGVLLLHGMRRDGVQVRVEVQDVVKLELGYALAAVDDEIRLIPLRHVVKDGPDLAQKPLSIQRLCEIAPRVDKIALQRELPCGRHDEDGHGHVILPDALGGLDAVDAVHDHVKDQQVIARARLKGLYQAEPVRIGGQLKLHPLAAQNIQRRGNGLDIVLIVVADGNPEHVLLPFCGFLPYRSFIFLSNNKAQGNYRQRCAKI